LDCWYIDIMARWTTGLITRWAGVVLLGMALVQRCFTAHNFFFSDIVNRGSRFSLLEGE
jgi:hypothetical protein